MRQILPSILKQLAIESPYSECFQIQTFLIVQDLLDITTPNAGKLEEDYILGSYWNLEYVNSGKLPENLKVTYPLVAVEQKRAFKTSWKTNEITYEYYIIVADNITCDIRGKSCIRTPESIQDDTYNFLCSLISESYKFALYNVKFAAETTNRNIWSTDDRIQSMLNSGEITSSVFMNEEMEIAFDEGDRQEISTWGIGIPNVMGAAATVNIKFCTTIENNWNIDARDNIDSKGKAQCADC